MRSDCRGRMYYEVDVEGFLADPAFACCSPAARGIWTLMICVAADSPEPNAVLLPNGAPVLAAGIARLAGETLEAIKGLLGELKRAGLILRRDGGGFVCVNRYFK